MRPFLVPLVAAFLGAAACSSSGSAPSSNVDGGAEAAGATDAATGVEDARDGAADAASVDASKDRGVCAATFGNALTAGFGRIDGVVTAVQIPSDAACALPNSDHVIVQVRMGGAVYRLVVNVQSDRAGQDARVRLLELDAPLPAPAFAEGWHLGAALDYVALGAHSTASTPMTKDEIVARLTGLVGAGDRVAIYATCGAGRPESAHLVHRNLPGEDGAIVLAPEAPRSRFVLFHFAEQTF